MWEGRLFDLVFLFRLFYVAKSEKLLSQSHSGVDLIMDVMD